MITALLNSLFPVVPSSSAFPPIDLTASDNSVPPWISGEFDVSTLLRGTPVVLTRAQFLDDVERQLQIARQSIDSRFAVLLVSLDYYGDLVAAKGRTAADMAVRTIADPIGPLLARHDSIALLENGQVGVLLETARLHVSAEAFATEIVGEMKAAATASGIPAPSITVGIAKITGNYASAEDVLKDAGFALHAAGAAGRGQTVTFHRGMDEPLNETPIAI